IKKFFQMFEMLLTYNVFFFFFFFNDTATTEIYTVGNTLSLHDALPISRDRPRSRAESGETDSAARRAAREGHAPADRTPLRGAREERARCVPVQARSLGSERRRVGRCHDDRRDLERTRTGAQARRRDASREPRDCAHRASLIGQSPVSTEAGLMDQKLGRSLPGYWERWSAYFMVEVPMHRVNVVA